MTESIQPAESTSSVTSPQIRPTDPFYDPPFFNDQPFREQPFMKRIANFASKHRSEGLLNAMGNHILSHIEFGGCLADYRGMAARYNKIRALEDVDEIKAAAQGHPAGAYARVRFVNYYTLSSGKPKPPKATADESQDLSTTTGAETSSSVSPSKTQCEEVNRCGDEMSSAVMQNTAEKVVNDDDDQSLTNEPGKKDTSLDIARLSMQDLEPAPMDGGEHHEPQSAANDANLPPIPEAPETPKLPNLELFMDKDDRKQAEKESKRLQKAYAQAVKDRKRVLREREKLLEKRRRKSEKESQRLDKEALKEKQKIEREEKKRLELEAANAGKGHQDMPGNGKPKKPHKFCTLPSKVNGERDSTWVDVFMDGMDEVSAHCGLFIPGEHYDMLVGDVGTRIQSWVQEDMSKRAALASTGLGGN